MKDYKKDKSFKVGDKVRIISTGRIYPAYKTMAELMKAQKWEYDYDLHNFSEDDNRYYKKYPSTRTRQ